jgi:hypothetical protein
MEEEMRFKVVVLSVAIWLAGSLPVSAKKIPPRPFFLPTPVTLDGAEVPSGMYQLAIVTSDRNVRVNLWRDGTFIATSNGAWANGGVKYKENAVLLRVNTDGSRTLIEIRLAGSTKSIVLNHPESAIQFSKK